MTTPPPTGDTPPPSANLPPEDFASPHRVIAGFRRRLAAFTVDSALLAIVGWIIGAVAFDRLAALGPAGRCIGFVIAGAYFSLGNSSLTHGQTVGKRLLRILVVNQRGEPVGVARSALRYLVFAVPFFLNGLPFWYSTGNLLLGVLGTLLVPALGLSILYLLVFNRRSRQGLHDLIAGTYVVRAEPTGAVAPMGFWRPHWAIVGALTAILLVLSWGGNAIARTGLFSELLATREAIMATGKVHNAGVYVGRTMAWKGGHDAARVSNYVAVSAFYKQRPRDYEADAREVAAITLDKYPAAAEKDVLQVNIIYGFDIGIARAWTNRAFAHTPAEWNSMRTGRTP